MVPFSVGKVYQLGQGQEEGEGKRNGVKERGRPGSRREGKGGREEEERKDGGRKRGKARESTCSEHRIISHSLDNLSNPSLAL